MNEIFEIMMHQNISFCYGNRCGWFLIQKHFHPQNELLYKLFLTYMQTNFLAFQSKTSPLNAKILLLILSSQHQKSRESSRGAPVTNHSRPCRPLPTHNLKNPLKKDGHADKSCVIVASVDDFKLVRTIVVSSQLDGTVTYSPMLVRTTFACIV